ncbi:hypothetical protein D3C73_1660280 [compost metagenome]
MAVTPDATSIAPPTRPSVTVRVDEKALPLIASVPRVVLSPSFRVPVAAPRLLSCDTCNVPLLVTVVPPV